MNYMRELNAFREWTLLNEPSTGEVALWHVLMSINNMTGWAEWFSVPNQTLQLMTGLSRQGLERARKALIERGLIEYQKGDKHHAGMYHMVSISESQNLCVNADACAVIPAFMERADDDTETHSKVGTKRADCDTETNSNADTKRADCDTETHAKVDAKCADDDTNCGQVGSTLYKQDIDETKTKRSGVCVYNARAREENVQTSDIEDEWGKYTLENDYVPSETLDPFADDEPKYQDPAFADPVTADLLREFNARFGHPPNEVQKALIKRCVDEGMSPELIRYDMDETKLHDGKAGYFTTILRRQLEQGIKTVEQEQEQFKLVISKGSKARNRDRPIVPISERQRRTSQELEEWAAEEGVT